MIKVNELYTQMYGNVLSVNYRISDRYLTGLKGEIIFENKGNDTLSISNVVPFGEDTTSVFITG